MTSPHDIQELHRKLDIFDAHVNRNALIIIMFFFTQGTLYMIWTDIVQNQSREIALLIVAAAFYTMGFRIAYVERKQFKSIAALFSNSKPLPHEAPLQHAPSRTLSRMRAFSNRCLSRLGRLQTSCLQMLARMRLAKEDPQSTRPRDNVQ